MKFHFAYHARGRNPAPYSLVLALFWCGTSARHRCNRVRASACNTPKATRPSRQPRAAFLVGLCRPQLGTLGRHTFCRISVAKHPARAGDKHRVSRRPCPTEACAHFSALEAFLRGPPALTKDLITLQNARSRLHWSLLDPATQGPFSEYVICPGVPPHEPHAAPPPLVVPVLTHVA